MKGDWDSLHVDYLDWTCGCGSSYGIENPQYGEEYEMKCKSCGSIAYAEVKLRPAESGEAVDGET